MLSHLVFAFCAAATRIAFLSGHLSGSAALWHSSLAADINVFEEYLTALRDHFGAGNSPLAIRNKLTNLFLSKEQYIIDFLDRSAPPRTTRKQS